VAHNEEFSEILKTLSKECDPSVGKSEDTEDQIEKEEKKSLELENLSKKSKRRIQ